MARDLSATETAQHVRAKLKKQFSRLYPSVRFSVTTKSTTIYVRWIDGPPQTLVEEALRLYRPENDGRRESHYINREYVTFGARYLFCERSFSAPFLRIFAEQEAKRAGLPVPQIKTYDGPDGPAYLETDWSVRVGDAYLSDLILRAAREADSRDYRRQLNREEVVEVVAVAAEMADGELAEHLIERPYTVEVRRKGAGEPWSWVFLNEPASVEVAAALKSLGAQHSPKWTAIRKCGAAYFIKDQDAEAAIYAELDGLLLGQTVVAGVDQLSQVDGAAVAERFRDLAQTQADYAVERREQAANGKQNTHRRVQIARSIEHSADWAEQLEGLLLGAADAWELGELPAVLKRVRFKSQIEVLRTYREMPRPDHDAARLMIRAGIHSGNYHLARAAILDLQRVLERESPALRELRELRRSIVGVPIPGFFPTPRPIVDLMLSYAQIGPEDAVLEPSAGAGHICGPLRESCPEASLVVVEINHMLRQILLAQGFNLIGHDMLELQTARWTKIVANPKFEGGQDGIQTMHAVERLLREGGRYVGIVSKGALFRSDAAALAFQRWLKAMHAHVEDLPPDAFLASDRATGTRTALVVIDKEGGPDY